MLPKEINCRSQDLNQRNYCESMYDEEMSESGMPYQTFGKDSEGSRIGI